jgi:inner membrane protein
MRIKWKLAVIAAILVVLAVPLLLVVSKIYERSDFRDEARADIARSWTGEQQVMGPMLVVNYVQVTATRELDGNTRLYVMRESEMPRTLVIVPDTLDVVTELDTQTRYRGIYEVPVYTSRTRLTGTFSTDTLVELYGRHDVKDIDIPLLSLGVSDPRGIAQPPELGWGEATYQFEPGSGAPFQPAGIHAPLKDLRRDTPQHYAFSVNLELRGMSSFGVAPVGDSSTISIRSHWPHPSFEGLYLPVEREVLHDGFTASWQTSRFASNVADQVAACLGGDCGALLGNTLGVRLVEPVDVYLQAQRATKYGMLFIGLTFTAFFLFEVLKNLAIHPIQYGLVGLALAIFYLLLISLAEHIAFGSAYLVAAVACCGLLAFYVSYVLGSPARGLAFGGSVGMLYAILYIIIMAEDYALSMGALLVFVALAAVMYVTRRIDWYRVGE